jgi:hypothetical protein
MRPNVILLSPSGKTLVFASIYGAFSLLAIRFARSLDALPATTTNLTNISTD